MPHTPSGETVLPLYGEKTSGSNQMDELQEAHTADKERLFTLILSSREEVLLAILRNPFLDHLHLQALLKRRGLGAVITAIHADKRFMEIGSIKCAVAAHPDTPPGIAQSLLSLLYIFDQLKLCYIPGVPPDTRIAAERKIVQQIPTQPLGNKITLARRGTAAILEALLREAQPKILEACLDNPHLKEGVLYQFLVSSVATAEAISQVARSNRWKSRPNIRLAILKNPRTPLIWFSAFLPGMAAATLHDLLVSPRLTYAQKELVRQAVSRPHI